MNDPSFLKHEPTSIIEQMMMMHGDPDPTEHNWGHIELVTEAIEKLEETERFLIELRFFHRFPYSKITALMGYSSKSVAWYNVQRALTSLKDILLENEEINDTYG